MSHNNSELSSTAWIVRCFTFTLTFFIFTLNFCGKNFQKKIFFSYQVVSWNGFRINRCPSTDNIHLKTNVRIKKIPPVVVSRIEKNVTLKITETELTVHERWRALTQWRRELDQIPKMKDTHRYPFAMHIPLHSGAHSNDDDDDGDGDDRGEQARARARDRAKRRKWIIIICSFLESGT